MDNFSDTTKLAIEICQQRRLPWDLRPRRAVSQPRNGCKVEEIDLFDRKEVTGSLSPRFSELPDLQVLELGHTEVSGDIEALKSLTKLEKLYLRWTKVSGNIAALENLTELTFLYLYNTQVSGDIEALQNLRKLKRLKIGHTEVSGDLLALKNLKKLKTLNLARTNVIGDMSALENLTSLENLYIKGTKITCEDAALRAVLRSLGLQEEQLTSLKNFEGVKRMLSCRNMKVFLICFLHMIWRIKLDHAWPEWPDHVLFTHVGWFSDTLILLTWGSFPSASSIFV